MDERASFAEVLAHYMEDRAGIEDLDALGAQLGGAWVDDFERGRIWVDFDGDFVRAVIDDPHHGTPARFWIALGEVLGLDEAERLKLALLWIDSHAPEDSRR